MRVDIGESIPVAINESRASIEKTPLLCTCCNFCVLMCVCVYVYVYVHEK